jgi:phage shock protein PspC (stress-responsive transcriptional regulator)
MVTGKRLYQVHEGAMLSGVCMGLAAYFGIDVTIVRLIFVGLTVLTGGLWILAYLAMTLVIPYATTSEERAAAYGQPFNAAHLIDAFRRQQSAPGAQQWRKWQQQVKKDARAWRREWRRGQRQMRRDLRWWGIPPIHPEAGYAAPVLIGLLMPIAALLQVVVVLAFVASVVQLVTTGQIFGWQPPPEIPLWVNIVILVVILNMFTGPLQGLRRVYYYSGVGGSPWLVLWATLLWVGFMVACFSIAFHHWPELLQLLQKLGEAIRHYNRHPADEAFSGWGYLQGQAGAAIHTHIAAIRGGEGA